MSNVVPIGLPKRPNLSQRQGTLLRNFACHRRGQTDVFWLKENAELLNVLCSGRASIAGEDLAVYSGFYASAEERMRFFPQYYRFLLSICLDLEDLGFAGETGRLLCQSVENADLMACELSDLQRAEALRLLARRGCGAHDTALEARLIEFIGRSDIFALPNKKVAYELVHIVFYLSDYGAQSLDLPQDALTSLEYAGLLAFLDRDVDLLSEVCVALRFAGQMPSSIWEDWLSHELSGFTLTPCPPGAVNDAYHEYFVCNWWSGISGTVGFSTVRPSHEGLQINRMQQPGSPLRALSETMYNLGTARSGDWDQMRGILQRTIGETHQHVLQEAADSSEHFGTFFQGFARA